MRAKDLMRPLLAGNWKMHGLKAALGEIEAVARQASRGLVHADILICPPATLIEQAVRQAAARIAIGVQDCHPEPSGAHTGDISAEMLKDAGARYVILGHSERRKDHHETDALVAAKAKAAWRAGLVPIVCLGETETERDSGHAKPVVSGQLRKSIPTAGGVRELALAYQPVWAIGTGRTPTLGEIEDMHAHIRRELVLHLGGQGHAPRILYGGSVKAANAKDILALPEVGGALVGGASLKAEEFSAIVSFAKENS